MPELELRVGDVVTHTATGGNMTVMPTPANLKALGEVNVMLHPGGSVYTTRVAVLALKYRASDHPARRGGLCLENSGQARGSWWCSLPLRHDGNHRAYIGHDTSTELGCEWRSNA